MKSKLQIFFLSLLLPLVTFASIEDIHTTNRIVGIFSDELTNQDYGLDQLEWESIVSAATFAYQRIQKAIDSLNKDNKKDAIDYLDSAIHMLILIENTIPPSFIQSQYTLPLMETRHLSNLPLSESNVHTVIFDMHLMTAFIRNARSALELQRTQDAMMFLDNALLSRFVTSNY